MASALSPDAREKWVAFEACKILIGIVGTRYPDFVHAPLPRLLDRLFPARHNPDFSEVRWYGKTYYFTDHQAEIIEKLWHAWEAGTPRIGQERLTSGLRKKYFTTSMKEIFKHGRGKVAWGKMLRFDGKGGYWLEPPDEKTPQLQIAS